MIGPKLAEKFNNATNDTSNHKHVPNDLPHLKIPHTDPTKLSELIKQINISPVVSKAWAVEC